MAVTYNSLYMDTRQILLDHGVHSASLEAKELVCCVSGKTREQLVRDYHVYVSDEIEKNAGQLLERRLQGEPIAYITGRWEFYGLELTVNPSVLIPRSDTEVLASAAIDYAAKAGEGARVLDLCTGSGCVGLAVAAHVPGCRVVMADISEKALKVARANARVHDKNGRVACIRANALTPAPISLGGFDVIACNPPYIPEAELATLDSSVRDYEPMLALSGGKDGLDYFRSVAQNWKKVIKAGGRLIFECGYDQSAAVCDLLDGCGYDHISVLCDSQDIGRVVMGCPA